jgi:hypothetical protein
MRRGRIGAWATGMGRPGCLDEDVQQVARAAAEYDVQVLHEEPVVPQPNLRVRCCTAIMRLLRRNNAPVAPEAPVVPMIMRAVRAVVRCVCARSARVYLIREAVVRVLVCVRACVRACVLCEDRTERRVERAETCSGRPRTFPRRSNVCSL